jgi:RHS repeat-associated protein
LATESIEFTNGFESSLTDVFTAFLTDGSLGSGGSGSGSGGVDGSYRYGFNGQEKSDEIKGEGNLYSAEYWEYDSRTGRRWNLDPVPNEGISDYATFGNNPISNVDPNGAYFFGWLGSTSEQRKGAKAFAKETGGEVKNITSKNVRVDFGVGTNMQNSGVGTTTFYKDVFAKLFGKETHSDFMSQSFNARYGGKYDPATGRYGAPGPISGRVEMVDDPFTTLGPGLIRGLVGKLTFAATSTLTEEVAGKGATSLWPAASGGRTVVNGIEYTTHALERMQPVGTIMKGTTSFSRGIPPSVVENAIKFGKVTPGNTAAEVVRTFENVRVITNPQGTRVISVIKIGN